MIYRIVVLYVILSWICYGNAQTSHKCEPTQNTFSITCPHGWYVLSENENSVDLTNFPPNERLEGVIIKDRGAEISVEMSPFAPGRNSMEEMIASDGKTYDSFNAKVATSLSVPSNCLQASTIDASVDVGMKSIERDLLLYCRTTTNIYRFRLRAWKNDRRWTAYRATFFQLVHSFKPMSRSDSSK